MKPIVSPWIFYWLNIVHSLNLLSWIVLTVGGVALFGVCMGINIMSECSVNEKDEKAIANLKKWPKRIIISMGISLIVCVFVPDKEVLEQMVISSYITPANIETGKEEVKEMIDYIFEKVNSKEDE